MQINFIIMCFIVHIIGDYYLQDDEMSKLKKENFSGVAIHSAIYSIPFILIFILFKKNYKLIFLLLLLCLAHFVIDFIKYIAYRLYLKIFNTEDKKNKLKKYIKSWMIYIFDQILHILSIIVITYSFNKHLFDFVDAINNIMNSNLTIVLKWTLISLCLYKPANITFKIFFSPCKPKDNSENNSEENNKGRNNGAIIGFLERIIIAIFLYNNQYSAIGFVLTAKSIARYNKISEDAEFGEYYLIGTLFSTLFAIIMYNLIF